MTALWVVTHSYYYPDAGTGDWRSVHTDEDEARAAFETQGSIGMGGTVYLIRVDAEGWDEVDTRETR